MSRLKELVPDGTILRNRIDSELNSSFDILIEKTSKKRLELVAITKKLIYSYLLLIAALLIPLIVLRVIISSEDDVEQVFVLFGVVILFSLIVVIFTFIYGVPTFKRYIKIKNTFDIEITNQLLLSIEKILGFTIKHDEDIESKNNVKQILKENGLVTNPVVTVSVDDVYQVSGIYPVSISEFSFSIQSVNDVKVVNMGLFAEITLPKKLEGKTLIVTESDKGDFYHESVWNKLFQTSELRETVLEWNEFEEYLHVASTNEIEARYILTPNFMENLYKWWGEKNDKVRIVFKEDRFFILMPYKKIRFGYTTTSIKKEEISKYLDSICYPIWRILVLVDDLRL